MRFGDSYDGSRRSRLSGMALAISMHYDDIELPQSLASYGQEDFLDVLLAELQEQEAALPLQRFTSQGGWPDDDTLELGIESVAKHKQEVIIRVHCSFDEVVPTGCADIKHSASGRGTFEVVLDLEGQRAFIHIKANIVLQATSFRYAPSVG